MERLRAADYPFYIVSNGDTRMLAALDDHAEIADLVTDTISADEVEQYKPAEGLSHHVASDH